MWRNLLLVLLLSAAPAWAQRSDVPEALVGSWYSANNYPEPREVAGQSFDRIRSVVTREPNGEYAQIAYLYLGDKKVVDFARTGRWGSGGGRVWYECATVKINGESFACSAAARQEAVLIEVSANTIRSREDTAGSAIRGMIVTAVRVPNNFQLQP
jgi:hypothetical protein